MARSYQIDGTSALDARSCGNNSNVISFKNRVSAGERSYREVICQHIRFEDPCAHGFYSFEGEGETRSDKIKSAFAVILPALAMLLAIAGPALV